MSLTKEESAQLYKDLRADGLTDEDIADSMIWSVEQTPEEEAEISKQLKEFRAKHRKEMGWRKRIYWYFRSNYLCYKYRYQDWKAKRNEK